MRPVLFQTRDFAVEFALLALGVADGSVSTGDFLADRGKGRAPFGNRPRLAFVADPGGRSIRKTLGEFAPRGSGIDRALQIDALSASMRLSSSGRLTGGAARGGRASIAPIVSFVSASPSTRSDDGSSVSGKSLRTAEFSPAGRSSEMIRVTLAPSG